MSVQRDTVTGGLTVALGAALFAASFGVKDFAATGVGAGFLPRLAAILFLILGALLLVETWRRRPLQSAADKPDVEAGPYFGGPAAVLLSVALMAIYVGLLDSVGFVITTAVYIFCQTLILAKGVRRNLIVFGVVALATAMIAYHLFVRVFQVMLPAGLFG